MTDQDRRKKLAHGATIDIVGINVYRRLRAEDVWQRSLYDIEAEEIDLLLRKWQLGAGLDRNVWGPEDWHYEFGFTIPWQWQMLVAYHFRKVSVVQPENRLGLQMRGRSFEGLGDDDGLDALNQLGDPTDDRRVEVTCSINCDIKSDERIDLLYSEFGTGCPAPVGGRNG